jgi:hypothetical protein
MAQTWYLQQQQAAAMAGEFYRQAAAAEAARRQAYLDAIRSSGAKCQLSSETKPRECGAAAQSRCATCGRTFCSAHESQNRSLQVGGRSVATSSRYDLCIKCQDAVFLPQVEEARAAFEKAEAARVLRERAVKEHAAKVEKRERDLDWPRAEQRTVYLNKRIRALQGPSVGFIGVVGSVIVLCFGGIVVRSLITNFQARNGGPMLLASAVLFLLTAPIVLSIFSLVRFARQLIRIELVGERDQLIERRGCGEPTCATCYPGASAGGLFTL